MSKLVLGMSANYTTDDIVVFVRSLRNTGYAGHIAFITTPCDAGTRAFMEEFGVEAVPFSCYRGRGTRHARALLTRIFRYMRIPRFVRNQSIRYFWHCQSSRYAFYLKYLELRPEFTDVLISDVRDVFFQKDPFAGPVPTLGFFEEHACRSLGMEPYNASWIGELFGQDVLDKLSPMPIVCSGVTLAKRQACMTYLTSMCDLIAAYHKPGGYDQGVHNYLSRLVGLPDLQIFPYGNEFVANIGLVPNGELNFDADGYLLTASAKPVRIVHQYVDGG